MNTNIQSQRAEQNQALLPINKPFRVHTFGAFDIEGTGGEGNFISGGILLNGEYTEFTNPHDMLAELHTKRYRTVRLAAHNLTYDAGILLPHLYRSDSMTLINGSAYKVRLSDNHRNSCYMVDSLRFAGGLPLSRVGEAIGLPKFATPPTLSGDWQNTPEWYCETHHSLWCVECYLRRDVEIVQRYMTLFQNEINALGGEVQFTLASTAMDLFRRQFLQDEYKTPFKVRNDYARQAYYGGRVEPFKTGLHHNVNIYDINSLYPFVMVQYPMPNPNYLIGPVDQPGTSVIWKYDGVAHVKIHIPDMHIPPLPFRHNGKLYFPVGDITGYYTHAEIRYAIDMGASLITVYSSLYATQNCYPFSDYVKTLYAQRQHYKQVNDARELPVKIMLNSLYGKFGQRDDAGLETLIKADNVLEDGTLYGYDMYIVNGTVYASKRKTFNFQANYVNTLWAAHITGYARLTLYEYMLQAGETLLYCDTDSVFIQSDLDTSTALGGMKAENIGVSVEIFGPKLYRVLEHGTPIKLKAKGVPAKAKADYLEHGITTFSAPVGIKQAMILKPKEDGTYYAPSEWREMSKRMLQTNPKRHYYPLHPLKPDYLVSRPLMVTDLD